MKKNAAFIVVMLVFVIACAIVAAFAIVNEPQYVRVISVPRTTAPVCESSPLLNINTATVTELQTLPGIGEVRAADIVAYREERGGFLYLEELMEVRGIGNAVFESIRHMIYMD